MVSPDPITVAKSSCTVFQNQCPAGVVHAATLMSRRLQFCVSWVLPRLRFQSLQGGIRPRYLPELNAASAFRQASSSIGAAAMRRAFPSVRSVANSCLSL